MKFFWLSAALLLAGCATFPNMETHQYHMDSAILRPQIDADEGGIFVEMGNAIDVQGISDAMQSYLTKAGMTFPSGSKITVNPQNCIVTLRNTPANHAHFKKLFDGTSQPLYRQIN